jgi:hypothetical protein
VSEAALAHNIRSSTRAAAPMSSNERRLEHTVVVAVYASRSGERQAMRRLQASPDCEL